MKWATQYRKYPNCGETRIRRSLCLFPYSCNGTTYWLQKITLHQRYTEGYLFGSFWFTQYVTEGWGK
jgi:hypothetical protein